MSGAHLDAAHRALSRTLGLGDAVLLGLGSILGTGVFVSLAVAAGVTGPSVLLATAIAAAVATCNALSSAQLAAAHPVSGGAYEYGHHYLTPALGFTAGWMFLCAKSASAATAALGFAGYALGLAGLSDRVPATPLALAAVLALSAVAAAGMRRSSGVNAVIVAITLLALAAFVAGVAPAAWRNAPGNLAPFLPGDGAGAAHLLHATALMFVAYTGYGRIATLGEEVRDPRRVIPRAIIATLVVSASIYILVALAAVGAAGSDALRAATAGAAAPLEAIARVFGLPGAHHVVALGAVTAMLGVLLNLILGLSRILLAMGRRREVPALFARLDAAGAVPLPAVCAVGLGIAGLALIGDVKTTWSFSAFTVLVYYAINNLAALRLPPADRLYHRAWAWGGLASSLFLAFWVEPRVWAAGLLLIGAGLAWRTLYTRAARRGSPA